MWRGAYNTRYKGRYRYGRIWYPELNMIEYTHRVSYRELVGPIPEGCEIDHLCENRLCWEPTHLEAVTHKLNCYRRDHGHEFMKAA